MRLFLSAICVAAGLAAQSSPQANQSKAGAPLPDTVVFRFFFIRVGFLESIGDRQAAAGKDARGSRTEIQRLARLTDSETSLVREIAVSCNAEIDSFYSRTKTEV